MRKKPQIFTRVDRQNTPVDLETLDALENEEMTEARRRKLVDLLFEQDDKEAEPEAKADLLEHWQKLAGLIKG